MKSILKSLKRCFVLVAWGIILSGYVFIGAVENQDVDKLLVDTANHIAVLVHNLAQAGQGKYSMKMLNEVNSAFQAFNKENFGLATIKPLALSSKSVNAHPLFLEITKPGGLISTIERMLKDQPDLMPKEKIKNYLNVFITKTLPTFLRLLTKDLDSLAEYTETVEEVEDFMDELGGKHHKQTRKQKKAAEEKEHKKRENEVKEAAEQVRIKQEKEDALRLKEAAEQAQIKKEKALRQKEVEEKQAAELVRQQKEKEETAARLQKKKEEEIARQEKERMAHEALRKQQEQEAEVRKQQEITRQEAAEKVRKQQEKEAADREKEALAAETHAKKVFTEVSNKDISVEAKTLDDAYKLIGIKPSVGNVILEQAYQARVATVNKIANKHHSENQLRALKAAYDLIKRTRGIENK